MNQLQLSPTHAIVRMFSLSRDTLQPAKAIQILYLSSCRLYSRRTPSRYQKHY